MLSILKKKKRMLSSLPVWVSELIIWAQKTMGLYLYTVLIYRWAKFACCY
jgi:hypothetical protein